VPPPGGVSKTRSPVVRIASASRARGRELPSSNPELFVKGSIDGDGNDIRDDQTRQRDLLVS
jgi:hypothetical protein